MMKGYKIKTLDKAGYLDHGAIALDGRDCVVKEIYVKPVLLH